MTADTNDNRNISSNILAQMYVSGVYRPSARGLHSSPFQLNLSALYGIGGARRGCVARVKGVLGGVQGVYGMFLCQTRLRLS